MEKRNIIGTDKIGERARGTKEERNNMRNGTGTEEFDERRKKRKRRTEKRTPQAKNINELHLYEAIGRADPKTSGGRRRP